MSKKPYFFYILLSIIFFNCSISLKAQSNTLVPNITAEHLFLANFAGSWKLNVAVYAKGSEGTYYIGKSENKLILNEHFIKFERDIFSGGVLFTSMQIIGYDEIKKKFFLISMDDLNNNFKYFEGIHSEDKKQIIFNNVDSFSDTVNQMKIILTLDRDNKYKYEVFSIEGNQEIKTMEILSIKQ